MARPHALQGPAKALLIEGLEQVVDRADLECLDRIGVVGGDEHQRRQLRGIQRARKIDAVQGIHLNVEKQQLRRLQSNRRQGGGSVAVFAHHAQVVFRLAEFAQGAPAGLLVVDDDDVHHASANAGARRRLARGRLADRRHARSRCTNPRPIAPAVSSARPSNCTARRSRTLFKPMPPSPDRLVRRNRIEHAQTSARSAPCAR